PDREAAPAESPARDLRERIADAAREHGAACARAGRADTTAEWRRMRVLLAELTRRAEAEGERADTAEECLEAAERARRGLESTIADVCRALGLDPDDAPRGEVLARIE